MIILSRFFRNGRRSKTTEREMTPDEVKAFDATFERMNEAFKAMDEMFDRIRK